MTRTLHIRGIVLLLGTTVGWVAHATVPAGAQLPLKAVEREFFKGGEAKRVKFVVADPEDVNDTSAIAKLAGCTIEGDAAFNPKTARLYVKRPTLTCPPDAKIGSNLLPGSDITGQLSDSGVDGIRLECTNPKECTVGRLKKGAEASFTVTESLGGAD
ncbi:MAG TPA: hypothetical protein VFM48_04470 [Aquabacterium sp.]|nr:hypothetical protein [Aquabacterium sp.]